MSQSCPSKFGLLQVQYSSCGYYRSQAFEVCCHVSSRMSDFVLISSPIHFYYVGISRTNRTRPVHFSIPPSLHNYLQAILIGLMSAFQSINMSPILPSLGGLESVGNLQRSSDSARPQASAAWDGTNPHVNFAENVEILEPDGLTKTLAPVSTPTKACIEDDFLGLHIRAVRTLSHHRDQGGHELTYSF